MVVSLTVIPFLPAISGDFVNWDDFANIVDNPDYRGLGWSQLRWMFTTFHHSLYRPVTWITFGIDYLLWDMNPAGYHVTSLAFHCATTALFYAIALRLFRAALPVTSGGEWPLHMGAGFAALFFSLHPLRVEAVAWLSARNDVVSAFFFLLSIYCYLGAVNEQGRAANLHKLWFVAAVALHAVSLLAKGIGMTLPIVLLILDIYPLRRLGDSPRSWLNPGTNKVLLEKIPFFVLAFGAGLVAVWAKQESQVFYGLEKYGLPVRIGESFYGLAFYFWKTFLPFGLSPLYERSNQTDPWTLPFFLSALFVLASSAAAFMYRRRWPTGSACWAYYVVVLTPVLGLVQFGPQMVADRYTYCSGLAWGLLAGAGYALAWSPRFRESGNQACVLVSCGLGLIVLVGLGYRTWQQTKIWHDSERLWKHALAIDSNSAIAHHNLASAMKSRGNLMAASDLYRKAIQLNPKLTPAHQSLGEVLMQRREYQEAAKFYRSALALDPKSAITYQHLGNAMARQGDLNGAISNYLEALRLNPDHATIHNDLGAALALKGDIEEAVLSYQKAAKLDANAPEPYLNLGTLMVRQNRLDQALGYYNQALKINSNYAQAHYYLGRLLAAQGRLAEAATHFRNAVKAQPLYREAHQSLVQVLLDQGKNDEAMRQHQVARQILGAPGSQETLR